MRSQLASASSSSVTPVVASTRNSTTSAVFTAASTWRLTFASRSLPPGNQPPVSTSMKWTPSQSASVSLRSRVTPGRSSTMATCSPTIRLNSVLLPTLGRPTMTTVGKRHDAGSRALRSEMPSVATTSTGRGSSSMVVPSRKRPSDRHTSGSRYRWPAGSSARTRCRSWPTINPVTAVLPPKNSLATGMILTSERWQTRR